MSPTQIENNLKTGQPVSTPFDNTQGAMDTINRDLAKRAATPQPVEKGQTLYHGANAEGTKAIESTGTINPDSLSQAHLTPDKGTADAYARANGGKTFSVNGADVPEDVLQHYKETGRGPIVLTSEHTVPVNEVKVGTAKLSHWSKGGEANLKPNKATKKAPKGKATEFNPTDLSKNSAPSLTERMKNALS
jgi:hypothetical protein